MQSLLSRRVQSLVSISCLILTSSLNIYELSIYYIVINTYSSSPNFLPLNHSLLLSSLLVAGDGGSANGSGDAVTATAVAITIAAATVTATTARRGE